MSILKSVQSFGDYTPPTGLVTDVYSTNDYRGGNGNGMWFFNPDGSARYFSYSGHDSAVKAYERCAPVSAIINKQAQMFLNGRTWLMNTMGKQATSNDAKKVSKLLAKPNPLQTQRIFEAQLYIYHKLFGFAMILPIKPVGFPDNIDASALWNIPPFMLDIKETKKLFYQSDNNGIIEKIVLNYKGTKTILLAKDIYFIKDFTPSFESLVVPESRLKALALPINNIIGAYESRNVMINYRGALGLLSSDAGGGQFGGLPLAPDDKDQLQDDFKRYGLKNNQWKVIITSAAMKWQQMGYPTKDLMLFEEIEDSTMAICDAFAFPYRLLSQNKTNSLGGSDAKEFNKMAYQDGVIPDAENIYEQFHQFFDLDRFNLRIEKDFSHIPVLQDDAAAKATARKTLNSALEQELRYDLITFNRWRELNGEDSVTDGDVYFSEWVKTHPDPYARYAGSAAPIDAGQSTDNQNTNSNGN